MMISVSWVEHAVVVTKAVPQAGIQVEAVRHAAGYPTWGGPEPQNRRPFVSVRQDCPSRKLATRTRRCCFVAWCLLAHFFRPSRTTEDHPVPRGHCPRNLPHLLDVKQAPDPLDPDAKRLRDRREHRPMTPKAVLRSYFAISGVYTLSASLIWGVNTLFLLDAGLDILGVFLVGAAFTAGNVLFEIPTGVVADTVGRRASFLLSVSILSVGTLAYVAIPWAAWNPLVPFAVASVLLGLGFTFYSGAMEAWLVDALAASGFEGNLDTVFSRGAMVSGAAMLIGTLGGGLLGQLDLSIPFLARSVLLALAFVLALSVMRDIGFAARPLGLEDAAQGARPRGEGGPAPRLEPTLPQAAHAGVRRADGFIVWGFYAWQPYFQELLETDAVWFAGVVAAAVALSTMVGNAVVERFARLCGKRTTLLLWAASIQTVAAIAVGLSPSFPIALTCLLVVTATMGVVGPVRQAYIHQMVSGPHRATVVSLDSMVANLGGVGGQTGLGYLARAQDYSTGYVIGGAFTVLSIPLYLAIRLLREDADRIVGKAGKDSPCAAQGIASVGAVDDRRVCDRGEIRGRARRHGEARRVSAGVVLRAPAAARARPRLRSCTAFPFSQAASRAFTRNSERVHAIRIVGLDGDGPSRRGAARCAGSSRPARAAGRRGGCGSRSRWRRRLRCPQPSSRWSATLPSSSRPDRVRVTWSPLAGSTSSSRSYLPRVIGVHSVDRARSGGSKARRSASPGSGGRTGRRAGWPR